VDGRMDRRTSAWNMTCHLLDGTFFFAALISISREIVIPQMITDLSRRAIFLGLVPLVTQVGMLLPQAFYAKRVEGLPYKKRAVLLCAVLQRAGWLVFLGSLLWRWQPAFTLTVLFVVLAANSLGSGLIIPVWTDWYAKTVPEGVWARLLGWRRAVPALLGIPLGELIQRIVHACEAPRRYELLVGMGLVFYALSLLFVALVKEERHEGLPTQADKGLKEYMAGLLRILFARRDFGLFMLGCLLVALPMAVLLTFLTRYGLGYPGVEPAITGTWTKLYFGTLAVGALSGGLLSDRLGPIAPFRLFPLFTVAAACWLGFSARPEVVSGSWMLVGFACGVQMVVVLPAVFRYSGAHRRPSYMAVNFITMGTSVGLVPPLVGLLLDAGVFGYRTVFLIFAVVALAGWGLFVRMPPPQAEAT